MERLSFENKEQSKLAFYRFQQLVLDSFKEFNIPFSWQGAVWGKISRLKKKGLTNEQIEHFLEKIINDTRELAKREKGAYFICLMNKYNKYWELYTKSH